MSMIVNPRSLGIETQFFTGDVSDLIELRARILEAGHAERVAAGIIGWLVAKAAGESNSVSPTTKAEYRKILRDLARNDGGGQGGRARLLTLAGLGAVTTAALTGAPSAAALLAAPIIYVL